jgi:hypothetical protein
MESEGKERHGMERLSTTKKGMAWHSKARHGFERQVKA